MMHQYTMTKDEPLFRQAKANADLLSSVSKSGSHHTQYESIIIYIHVYNCHSYRYNKVLVYIFLSL